MARVYTVGSEVVEKHISSKLEDEVQHVVLLNGFTI